MMLSVIVPTYNERENIEKLVARVHDVLMRSGIDGEVIVVDDGSLDGTADIVRSLMRKHKNIRLLERKEKKGIGNAYKFAFTRTRGTYVMEMDADFSHNPNEIPRFLEAIKMKDLVVGSRYVVGGRRNDPFHRRIFPMIGNFLYKLLLGFPTTDTTSGFRIYRAAALKKIDIKAQPDDYSFQSSMVFEFAKKGLRVGEVPISFAPRRAGKPKYGVKDLLGNLALLFKLALRR